MAVVWASVVVLDVELVVTLVDGGTVVFNISMSVITTNTNIVRKLALIDPALQAQQNRLKALQMNNHDINNLIHCTNHVCHIKTKCTGT